MTQLWSVFNFSLSVPSFFFFSSIYTPKKLLSKLFMLNNFNWNENIAFVGLKFMLNSTTFSSKLAILASNKYCMPMRNVLESGNKLDYCLCWMLSLLNVSIFPWLNILEYFIVSYTILMNCYLSLSLLHKNWSSAKLFCENYPTTLIKVDDEEDWTRGNLKKKTLLIWRIQY